MLIEYKIYNEPLVLLKKKKKKKLIVMHAS